VLIRLDIFKLVINSLTVHYHGREVALITCKINGVEKVLTNGMTCVTLYFYLSYRLYILYICVYITPKTKISFFSFNSFSPMRQMVEPACPQVPLSVIYQTDFVW
jgi:hypothetical protein